MNKSPLVTVLKVLPLVVAGITSVASILTTLAGLISPSESAKAPPPSPSHQHIEVNPQIQVNPHFEVKPEITVNSSEVNPQTNNQFNNYQTNITYQSIESNRLSSSYTLNGINRYIITSIENMDVGAVYPPLQRDQIAEEIEDAIEGSLDSWDASPLHRLPDPDADDAMPRPDQEETQQQKPTPGDTFNGYRPNRPKPTPEPVDVLGGVGLLAFIVIIRRSLRNKVQG